MKVVHVDDNYPGAVYVGRPMPGRRGSIFANPFKIKDKKNPYERSLVCSQYADMLGKNPMLLERLHTLRNAPALACWCRHANEPHTPANPCHADILVWYLTVYTDDQLKELAANVRRTKIDH